MKLSLRSNQMREFKKNKPKTSKQVILDILIV